MGFSETPVSCWLVCEQSRIEGNRRHRMNPLLSMRNMEKSYGSVKALDGVRFEVAEGEVHALIGANGAGKSTLMKVLCGELDYEGGDIVFAGEKIQPRKVRDMREQGVVMIRQELCTVPVLTVAQYLFLGREPTKGPIVDDRRMEELAAKLLEPVGAVFSPHALMGELSMAEQQLVEIAKAISYEVRLLILDEPTTALGEYEVERVISVIRSLKQRGVSVIYISHRLEELFEISDKITVMRDGQYIATLDTATTQKSELIRLLAGRDLKSGKKTASSVAKDAPVVLQVEGLATEHLLRDVRFSLRKGEVLGLAGLMGSGRSETVRALCGIDPKSDGTITVFGKKADIRSPKQAADVGICYLPEDRNGEGLIPGRSIIGNSVLSSLDAYQNRLTLDDQRMLDDAVAYNALVKTKYADPHAPVSSLSGGNAQKVVIARWLIRDCPILIFDEPTKGIDVGAKDEIYQIIADLVSAGRSVILISSETDELLANCDRILVMWEGRISKELAIEDATLETIMHYAHGGR